jgi:TolB-like protein
MRATVSLVCTRGVRVPLPLLAELKRRRVFRALVGYGLAAFAVLQISEPVMHGLHWPESVLSYLVVALALGFPIVVGLAWIFDVSAGGIERTRSVSPLTVPNRARVALVLVGIGLLAAAPGLTWYFVWRGRDRTAAGTARAASVAVLPFVNLSGDKDNEYFSDGMTEEIINGLANVEGVRVVARTSAFSFKGKNLNVRTIGEELNVSAVLEGSVRREGNRLRVFAQLIGAADGYHIWSKTFDRELKNVFAVEDEVASAIVQALTPKLVPQRPLVQPTTASTEAHDLYLKGRHLWSQRSEETLRRAKGFFEQAVALDPRFALAHSGLADCYSLSMDYSGARAEDVLPKAKVHALKAVELDDALAEGHASLGAISEHDYEWDTAERELKRAIGLRPGYATAHQWYAEVLLAKGRLPESRAEAERARQLDPASPIVNHILAVVFFSSRDYDRSVEQSTKTLELDPTFQPARAFLALGHLRAGRIAQSMAVLEGAGTASVLQPVRVQVLAARGDRTEAQRLLAEAEGRATVWYPRGALAAAHLALGEKDEAFAWLEKGVEGKDSLLPMTIRWNLSWDPIRSDPRFQKLLQRMNLD